jgi:spore germination protein KC
MHAFTDFDIFFGNLEFIIIGEDFARNGIGNSLDFFIRDHELRLTANIMVSIGTTAKDFIETTDMTSAELTDKLDSLFSTTDALSQTMKVTMLDLTKMMDSDTTQILLPCVNKVDKSKKIEARHEVGQLDASLNGYALFKRDKLVAIAQDETARGVSWLINEVKSGIILASDPEGNLVSLEIIDAETKIVPSNEEMSVTIEVKFTTNVGEILGNVDIFTEDIINELTNQQKKKVEQEISDAFELMREHQSDVVGLGNKFYHDSPIKWNEIKDDWCRIFAEIPYNIETTSRINRTYIITPPVEKKSEGSK